MTEKDFIRSFITVNGFSRTGKKRSTTLGIIMHNIGKAEQSAKDAIAYFEGLKSQNAMDAIPDVSASAQIVIDLDGRAFLLMELDEKAYHCGTGKKDPASGKVYTNKARELFGDFASFPDRLSPNSCTIGIEMCHKANGQFTEATMNTAREVCAFLCLKYKLTEKNILSHNEVVGWKECPLLWTKKPAYLIAFREDVRRLL